MPESPRLIKKYPNRRLYDTKTSSYITLNDVRNLVLAFDRFKVVNAKTDEDLTRSILLQILVEEEAEGEPLFSTGLLSQILRFHGHPQQRTLGEYLEVNIKRLSEVRRNVAGTVQSAL